MSPLGKLLTCLGLWLLPLTVWWTLLRKGRKKHKGQKE